MGIYKKTILFVLIMPLLLLSCGGKNVETQPPHQASANGDLILGNTWYMRGCSDKAALYFDKALEKFSAYDDRKGVATCLNNLGNLARIRKDLDTALLYLDESERIYTQINHAEGQVRVLSNKAAVYLDRGDLESAGAALDRAGALAQNHAVSFLPLGSNRILLLVEKNQIDQAKALMDQVLLSASPEKPFEWATLQHVAGYLMESAQQYEQALSYYTTALASDRKHYYLRGIADDLTAMGRVYVAMDRREEALDTLYRSMKVRTLLGDGVGIEETSTVLKQCLTTLGEKAPDTRITEDMLRLWSKGDTVAAPCE